ncbi:MAG: hypothetical protein MUF15_16825, partial [Acidobacteria bacterium]|nr:hypothetical protein [Acidobacteriota bacterium]
FLEKTNIRKNQFPMYSLLEKEKFFVPGENSSRRLSVVNAKGQDPGKYKSFVFTKNIHFVVKKQALQILKAEKQVQENFANSKKKFKFVNLPSIFEFLFGKTKQTLVSLPNKAMNFSESSDGGNSLFSPVKRLMNQIFKYRKNNDSNIFEKKNIDFWKKRENILLKRKKLCKTLKRLRNQKILIHGVIISYTTLYAFLK